MNETPVTIIGNAVEDPIRRTTRNSDRYVTFRLASTVRRRDASGAYVDAGTNFVTVVAFRQLAENIADSVHKGQPLIVAGRLRVNQWRNEEGRSGTSVEIDAVSVGHDLTRGIARFNRVRAGQVEGTFPPAVPEGSRGEAQGDPWAIESGAPVGASGQIDGSAAPGDADEFSADGSDRLGYGSDDDAAGLGAPDTGAEPSRELATAGA